jgi:hypothetical protein
LMATFRAANLMPQTEGKRCLCCHNGGLNR